MTRNLPIVAAIALVISAGAIHGRQVGRWARPRAVADAVARLDRVPMTVGDWVGSPRELDPAALSRAGIDGYALRDYRNARTGQSVSVLLVCGRPGPISVHTPDICYAGAGYAPTGPQASSSLPQGPSGDPAMFRGATFAKADTVVPSYLHILWSWSAGAGWRAPDNPRTSFASAPCLFKMYLVREASSPEALGGDGPGLAFARELLPRLGPVVGPGGPRPGA